MDISELSRRGFLGAAGSATFAFLAGRAVAGPFAHDPDAFPVPADKRFTPEWLDSLRARGSPLTASGPDLAHIGMPIGGVGCGQVYLSGDGRLWCWDVFNLPPAREWSDSAGTLYAKPAAVTSPIDFNVALTNPDGSRRPLNQNGFPSTGITFVGQYPIATVSYHDPKFPAKVRLTAFTPFCPLEVEDSSLPCTVLSYEITNSGTAPLTTELIASLRNPVAHATAKPDDVIRRNERRAGSPLTLLCRADAAPRAPIPDERPEIVFDDFETGRYEGWTATGTAFGTKPRMLADIARYQGNLNAHAQGLVNSHESRSGEDVRAADAHIGTLTSREFVIERTFISFRIGGGKHQGQTCMNLLVDGATVRTATGNNDNAMRLENWNVAEYAGRTARLQIVDGWRGEWGNIGIDDIVLRDTERAAPYELAAAPDFGTMALALLDAHPDARVVPLSDPAAHPAGELRVALTLAPGASTTIRLAIAWHFPNLDRSALSFIDGIANLKRHYAARFADAGAVTAYVAEHPELLDRTLLWRDTWYDSTLPCWFLERTFCNVSAAATSTCYRFDNGRFYGWEGTHCCPGTCTHVWQYAQGLARVFPQLERSLRRDIDFGSEFNADTGLIHYRGEAARSLAIDGQCGTIIRAYREHTLCTDDEFLRAVYPNVKKAMQFVIARDPQRLGILEGEQYNTLDTSWYGRIAWISSLYNCALHAAAALARDAGDEEFAATCFDITEAGRSQLPTLFNGEYFIHAPDPKRPDANSTGNGCHIDQMLGQSFAHQNNLPRVTDYGTSYTALASLYRYNFAPDIGPYRRFMEQRIQGGRWYAMPGEGGLLMCTWPKGGSDSATGKSGDAWAAGYFNECMTGFEHQVASHMIAEGLITEGLAITRMIHDRYSPNLRNPYNEVECSNHYARAMASYGSFVTACGFSHHGPREEIGFAPRIFAKHGDLAYIGHFRAPFIASAGWGTYSQTFAFNPTETEQTIRVVHGSLTIRTLTLTALGPRNSDISRLHVTRADGSVELPRVGIISKATPVTTSGSGTHTIRAHDDPIVLRAGDSLTFVVSNPT
jgi:uncharacterized protein (DUF608 family)